MNRNHPLSRKQLWRRKVKYLNPRPHSFTINFEEESSTDCEIPIEPEINREEIESDKLKGILKTEGKMNRRGYVIFNPLIELHVIPKREEYGPSLKDLFWKSEDYDYFKEDALTEIRSFLRKRFVSAKEAIMYLYQPEYDECADIAPDCDEEFSSDNEAVSWRNDDDTSDNSDIIEDSFENEIWSEESSFGNIINSFTPTIIEGVMKHVDSLNCLHSYHNYQKSDVSLSAEDADCLSATTGNETDNESVSNCSFVDNYIDIETFNDDNIPMESSLDSCSHNYTPIY